MAGFEVTKGLIDQKAGEAVVRLRDAFDLIEILSVFLSNVPSSGGDGLETIYGFSPDDAYLLRLTFEKLNALRLAAYAHGGPNNDEPSAFDYGNKFTGLS